MKTFIFNTTCTMKEYNNKKWWIDSNIIPEYRISETSLQAALVRFVEHCENHGVTISNNAIRRKSGMYVDTKSGETKQVGYVITGKTDFEDRDNYKYVEQYIDLWVEILTVVETDFVITGG